MKVAGIIAEYNPFHNGHQYHIEETRRRTGADYVIIAMSGDFVQRGAPALLSKYHRARMALCHGADLVLELPLCTALSSAEGFSAGGVNLLSRLGVVEVLSFGCEQAMAKPDLFSRVVSLLDEETIAYRQCLSSYLKAGHAYAKAQALACAHCLGEECATLLSSPNDTLGIAYARAAKKLPQPLSLCMIAREGSGYHDHRLSGGFSSATAIRSALLSPEEDAGSDSSTSSDRNGLISSKENAERALGAAAICDRSLTSEKAAGSALDDPARQTMVDLLLAKSVPPEIYTQLGDHRSRRQLLDTADFSSLLFYALLQNREHLTSFGAENPDLAARVARHLEEFRDWDDFCHLLKRKNQSYAAISRYLSHVLLGLDQQTFALAETYALAPYARVLGFRREAAPLMSAIQSRTRVPLIMQPARDVPALDPNQQLLYAKEARAAELHRHVTAQKSGEPFVSEYRMPLVVV